MSRILCVDTSSFICSVSVFENLSLISSNSTEVEKSHSKLLIQLIDQSLKDAKIKINEVDAFAVSMGPGSYTGLRIGVSTIKGLCYSLEKPLISINTLEILSKSALNHINNYNDFFICPMIDARRMEVFIKMLDNDFNEVEKDKALILDDKSFNDFGGGKLIYFFGDGSNKFQKITNNKNFHFIDNIISSSKYMGELANIKYENNQFENLTTFEPFYIKDFFIVNKNK
jgi:tRNA threonylcarbamoyladenosine biosynthesis protein TsaB|tara:strand:- start:1515 stop:2198 length:684 start_codon:yes stop_codon:yes gene_type:complete